MSVNLRRMFYQHDSGCSYRGVALTVSEGGMRLSCAGYGSPGQRCRSLSSLLMGCNCRIL
jgi:hypothetical protein